MDKFWETYNLPRLNQEDIDNLKRPITSSEIKFVIKKNPSKPMSRQDGFTGEFHQTYKEELIPILPKLIQKTKEEETLLNSFHKATITLIPKPDKDTAKKKITDQYFWWMYRLQSSTNISKLNLTLYKKDHAP